MRFGDFVYKLETAGWRSPNDAQYTNIRKVWEELFPHSLQFEKDLQRLRDDYENVINDAADNNERLRVATRDN